MPLKFIASTCMLQTSEARSDQSPCVRCSDGAEAFWSLRGRLLKLPFRPLPARFLEIFRALA